MASIVKELDKVTGATTRSHNIADAVSKLKTGGVFAVNITYDSSTSTYTADKTYNEIVEALGNGLLCVAYYGNKIMYLMTHSYNDVIFSSIYKERPEPGDTPSTIIASIYITNDNSVIFVN